MIWWLLGWVLENNLLDREGKKRTLSRGMNYSRRNMWTEKKKWPESSWPPGSWGNSRGKGTYKANWEFATREGEGKPNLPHGFQHSECCGTTVPTQLGLGSFSSKISFVFHYIFPLHQHKHTCTCICACTHRYMYNSKCIHPAEIQKSFCLLHDWQQDFSVTWRHRNHGQEKGLSKDL